MPNSAFYGQPPANERDLMIVKGMIAINGGHRDPGKGIPLGPPPHPRLTDSHAGRIVASCVIAMVFVIVITGTRVIAKFRSKRSRLGWDDWLIVLAALGFCSYAGLTLAMVFGGGLGKHNYNTTYSEQELKQHAAGGTWIVNFAVVVLTKLSIICFNARLTGLISTFWRWTHRIMFVAVSIWGVFLIPWYTCLTSPVPARYSFIYAGQHKWHYVHGAGGPQVAYVSIHITLDWILLAIPVYLVLKLQMPIAKRLRAIIPISVGCLSAIGAAYNCHLKSLTFKDQNYAQDQFISWRFLDLVCAVIATSLPAVASIVGKTIKLPLSWEKYFSSRGTPPVYMSHISNPFSSERPDGTGTGTGTTGSVGTDMKDIRTNRNRYEETGGNVLIGEGKHHYIDTDIESMPSTWESGHQVGSSSSQVHLRDKETAHAVPGTAM